MFTLIIGLLSSLFASLLIIYVLRFIKPKAIISKQIAKGKSSDGICEYQIKILNKSRRSLIDVSAEMYLIKPFKVKGGIIPEHRKINLKIDKRMEICGKIKHPQRELFEGANFIFLTNENIEEYLNDSSGSYILMAIGTTDSFSGVRKVFQKEYFRIEDIVLGEFVKGDSINIE